MIGVPAVSARVSVLAGVFLLACQVASAGTLYPPATASHHHAAWRGHAERTRPKAAPARVAVNAPAVRLTAYQPELVAPPQTASALSPQVWRVSQIAVRNGDRDFIMIDKVHGRIILFSNGAPVFAAAALTGANVADRLPEDTLRKSYAQEYGMEYRVTPAGRFTVSPSYDESLGTTYDINEIQGKDWAIAIHRAAGAGNRLARLRSPSDQDKHITEGCINVEPETMQALARWLPRQGATPLYILPMDERLITNFF